MPARKRLEARLKPIWPAVTTALGVAALLALGTWQLERRASKHALIEITTERLAAPAHIGAPGAADWRDSLFGRARLSGTWLHDAEFLLSSRVREGEVGYHVVTPLETGSGAIVLVNRGWVPLQRKASSTRPEGRVAGAVTVEGTVRAPGPWGWLAPDNDPVKDEWFYVDVPAMAAAAGLDNVMPYYLAAVPGPLPDTLPAGMPAFPGLPDNHLQYALTWYALAVALFAIYLIHRRRARVPADPAP